MHWAFDLGSLRPCAPVQPECASGRESRATSQKLVAHALRCAKTPPPGPAPAAAAAAAPRPSYLPRVEAGCQSHDATCSIQF
jgi:hypothetical protein